MLSLITYGMLAGVTPCVVLWDQRCALDSDLLQFGILQALPLPGFDKAAEALRQGLFSNANGLILTLVIAGQKILSLLSLFLFGLAVRNLFKMK